MRPEKTEPKAPSPIILPGLKSPVHLLISGKGKETGIPSAKAACIDVNICVGDTGYLVSNRIEFRYKKGELTMHIVREHICQEQRWEE